MSGLRVGFIETKHKICEDIFGSLDFVSFGSEMLTSLQCCRLVRDRDRTLALALRALA